MRRPTRREAVLAVAPAVLVAVAFVWLGDHEPTGGSTGGAGTGSVHAPSSFTISGDVRGAITPGAMVPLNLAVANPNDFALAIDRIAVTVQKVHAPRADRNRPCGLADFEVRQLSGRVRARLAAHTAHHLSRMGVARDHWPAVGMRNRPVNQDGCKGAVLTLGYKARGAEVPR